MKYAILSDIHGNASALQAVLAAAKTEGIEHYLIAGDFLGYYYGLPEILESLEGLSFQAVRGNHEDLFCRWRDDPESRPALEGKYGCSFAKNASLGPDRLSSILELPEQRHLQLEGRSVLLCHGAPWDHDLYVYPDTSTETVERLFSHQQDLLIMGHTHYPLLWQRDNSIVLNPGSVGQPRDRKGGACWAVWDTNSHQATLRRESYDPGPVLKDCQRFDPDLSYLQTVLTRR